MIIMIIWADIWDPTKQRVFESLGEKTERDSKATPISTIQGYGWLRRLRRLRMVTETWVMASGDVDVGWSRLISVDVALWFSSGAAFHAFLSIFSASAVLHEANLLSLLTELLTLHHDAIPLFSGNVLIWTKKKHFDLGRNWNLWSIGLFSKPWKESHNSSVCSTSLSDQGHAAGTARDAGAAQALPLLWWKNRVLDNERT